MNLDSDEVYTNEEYMIYFLSIALLVFLIIIIGSCVLLLVGVCIHFCCARIKEKKLKKLLNSKIIDIMKYNKNDKCVICYEQYSESEDTIVKLIDCEHDYHKKCIYEWLKYDKRCPLCMNNIV